MNRQRYQELLGRLLDDGLAGAEADEFSAGLSGDPDLRRDLRRHLVLWEIWSQHQAPERSSDAFLQAWKTRLRVENEDSDAFPDAVRRRFKGRQSRSMGMERLVQFIWTGVRRPASLAWAASALVLVLTAAFWLADPRSAQAVITLKGEAVCTACVLHESHEHAPAVRVVAGNGAGIYYLDRSPELTALQDHFCGGPNAATAEGTKRVENGRLLFRATTVTIPAANRRPETPTNSVRKIFPI